MSRLSFFAAGLYGVIDLSNVPTYISYVNTVTTFLQWSEFRQTNDCWFLFVCLFVEAAVELIEYAYFKKVGKATWNIKSLCL